jgi:N-acetylglucosaminyl-diphospho-decaprenol L-rhamnosyltransferase
MSAIVVNHNAGEMLRDCVASLRAEGVADVVVVDNASADDSLALLAKEDQGATVVREARNLGFGAGVNAGARAAHHDIFLVCNPDLVLHEGCVGALQAALDANPDVAVAGPRILDADGQLYPSARTFPTLGDALGHAFVGLVSERNRWTQRYKVRATESGTAGDVDWVSGACFAVRRDAFSSVGGFDLCWRLRRAGWRVLYEPGAVVTHRQGHSTSRRPYRMIAAHHRSMWRFARLSSSGPGRMALPAVALGIVLRFVLASTKQLLARASSRAPSRVA